MYALSIQQPWAWCIIHNTKRVENRGWKPNRGLRGQRFAIHASLKLDEDAIQLLLGEGLELPLRPHYDLGAIVGVATLADVVDDPPRGQETWWAGPVGFVLADVRRFDAIPCKGALSFWRLPADVEARVEAALMALDTGPGL